MAGFPKHQLEGYLSRLMVAGHRVALCEQVTGKKCNAALSPKAAPRAIKAGDRVACVDDSFSFNRLHIGQQYTVEAAYDGSLVVAASGAYHSIERFVLVS